MSEQEQPTPDERVPAGNKPPPHPRHHDPEEDVASGGPAQPPDHQR